MEREIRIMDVQRDKSAATSWCYHVNMDQNLWGMFPCWIYATKNYGRSEGKRGSNPGTSKGVPNKVAGECILLYEYLNMQNIKEEQSIYL